MNRAPEREQETILVIGGGMVAQRFVEQMVERDESRRYRIEILSEEAHPPYDRVHLTSYLKERRPEALQLAASDWYEQNGVALFLETRALAVDPVTQQVSTPAGLHHYDHLVFATGSRPFVPPIAHTDLGGVFLYRTIDDLERIARAAAKAKTAAVLGGGLLGLEAAKALVDLGLKTHVIEAAPRLMPRQLDTRAAQLLTHRIQELGIEIHLSANLVKLDGNQAIRAVELSGHAPIAVDLLVVSAGIRPCDELAKNAGITCGTRGGVIIDDTLTTSSERVYAIGECALHRETLYGLAAPGYAMAEILARRLAGEGDATFTGTDQSAKLKLLGVHVASAGNPFADETTGNSVVLDNFAAGVYRKIVLDASATRVLGAILVGDTELYGRLLAQIRSGKPLSVPAESLLMADVPTSEKPSAPQLDDLVCTCNSVTAGCLVQAVRAGADGCSLDTLKKQTRAGTGCGGCLPQVTQLMNLELARLGKAKKPRLCEHFNYTRQELFDLVKVRGYRSFEQLLQHHGQGGGCEVCKPAIASILASIQHEHVLEHANLQDTNDRFLANIQRRGLYSIVPRIPGGEITPRKLAVIAEVADRFGLYTKITGGQRIDLFGARVDQLPTIWAELIKAGFESGHAYGKALRTVKSCVGSTWCRFGVDDSVSFAIRVENRYKGIRSPHKLKSAVSGCIRECAEVQSKDFGYIATETGWNLYVCGNGGSRPRHADLLASGLDEEAALRLTDRFLMYYIRTADKLTRTSVWLDSLEGGIEHVRNVIVHDSLGIAKELEQELQQLVDSYECEWRRVVESPELRANFERQATQDEQVPLEPMREQHYPRPWPAVPNALQRVHLPMLKSRSFRAVADASSIPPDTGITVKVGKVPIAIFHSTINGHWYATQAQCPHKGDAVLGRGLLGDHHGQPKVACPYHKRTFSLETGECLNAESPNLATFPVKVEEGIVYVELPPTAELELAFERAVAECGGHCDGESQAAE